MTSIKGLQKTSMVDYPGIVACTIFISGCNFRCPFCQNPSLVNDSKKLKEFSEKEILDFLEKRKKVLDGVCITGGEPIFYKNLDQFIKKIKEKGYKIKLDTNGGNPKVLEELIKKDLLDFIAMDIKSDKENYKKAAGTEINIEDINKSIELIKKSGIDYEFRSTVIPSFFNEEIIMNIGKWLKGTKKYSLQQFKSDIPLLDKTFEGEKPFKKEVFKKFKEILEKDINKIEIRI